MSAKRTKSAAEKRIRRRNFSMFIIAVIILVCVCLFTPVFSVSNISVVGNSIHTNEAILSASNIKRGDNLFLVNTKKAEAQIMAMGHMENVKISRKFFSKLEITVTESLETAYVSFSGNYVGISASGKILSISKSSKDSPKKPLVSGYALQKPKVGEDMVGKDAKKTEILKSLLGALTENKLITFVKKIDITDVSSIGLTLNSDTKIILGEDDQIDYKLKCLNAVLEELGEIRGGKINVSDPSNVIYEGGN